MNYNVKNKASTEYKRDGINISKIHIKVFFFHPNRLVY